MRNLTIISPTSNSLIVQLQNNYHLTLSLCARLTRSIHPIPPIQLLLSRTVNSFQFGLKLLLRLYKIYNEHNTPHNRANQAFAYLSALSSDVFTQCTFVVLGIMKLYVFIRVQPFCIRHPLPSIQVKLYNLPLFNTTSFHFSS